MPDSRVPTSAVPGSRMGWSLETAIDYLLAIVGEKYAHVVTRMEGNDQRYEERFAASQRALDLGLAGQKAEITTALAAADRAVQKAEAATEKRFESVNEFRGTLDNQQRTLIARSEVEQIVRGLEEKISGLTKTLDGVVAEFRAAAAANLGNRTGYRDGYGVAVGVVGLIAAVLAIAAYLFKG
jgi:hypothetical protein